MPIRELVLDLFDILFLSFIGGGSPGWARSEDPAERAAGAVGMIVLPALAFCVVLFGGVVDPMLVLFGIPAACVAIVIGLCIGLRIAGIATVRIALGTVMASFLGLWHGLAVGRLRSGVQRLLRSRGSPRAPCVLRPRRRARD